MTYRTSNVARLAGAVSLPVFLAAWGLFSVLLTGETTVSTWALGLASMFPVSALLVAATGNRSLPRTGLQYAVGLVASVAVVSVAYLVLVVAEYAAIGTIASLDTLELVAVALVFALLGGALALVDVRYVDRPVTAARLENRYLDHPVRDD